MSPEQERLPRRDWLILPLLSVLALGLVLAVGEMSARVIWPEHLQDRCAIPDPAVGVRFQANCRAQVKSAETPWLENAYNECGFRTAESCGPKPENGFRVAVIGSSISSGYLVPYAETFAARATAALEERCHVPVDFQNLAVPGVGLEKAPLHLDAALALRPNVVLMALSAHDMEILGGPPAPTPSPPAAATAPVGGAAHGPREILRGLAVRWRTDPAIGVVQHFLYQNLDSYLPLYLQHGDEADYLRAPFSAAWQGRLARFDREIGEIAARTQAQGASFMLVFVPLRAQAVLLRWKHLPADIDPTLLGRALGGIARHHGAAYLDLTETIGDRADVASLYYPLDSHPNGAASAIIADAVVGAMLAQDGVPASCHAQVEAVQ